MYLGDSLLLTLNHYRYDLYRGDLPVHMFLSNHFNKYCKDISMAASEENPFVGKEFISKLGLALPLLSDFSDCLVGLSEAYRNGQGKRAYDEAYCLLERMSPYFLQRFQWKGSNEQFIRIRNGDYRITDGKVSKEQKAQMFHIKNDLRHKIGAYRYSVSGYPCLYLSSGEELAWFECGMPKQFSYCRMLITEEGENALRLVDFSNTPADIISSIHVWLLGARKNGQKDQEDKIYNYLLNYILTYPLAAACSMRAKQRNNKFVEEYVIPQMFMQWIRESDEFDGVRYKSSLYTNLVEGMGAVNIALPVKAFRPDGLCKKLTSSILVSDIGYFDVNKDFEKYSSHLHEIERFMDVLWSDILNEEDQGSYVWQLIEVCETVLRTYNALMEGNYLNGELLFNHIDRLHDYIHCIYRSKTIIVDDCLKKAQSENTLHSFDEDKINSHIDKFYKLMSEVVRKHTVFNFRFDDLDNFENI
ncbi:MAG: hypothetical protein FWH57_07565 [Oscillospiraceae bacterium]|nr:hypothetical protein [Oscillospiraceae bacterium]